MLCLVCAHVCKDTILQVAYFIGEERIYLRSSLRGNVFTRNLLNLIDHGPVGTKKKSFYHALPYSPPPLDHTSGGT